MILLASIIILFSTVCDLLLPTIMSDVLNYGIHEKDFNYIVLCCAKMLVISFIGLITYLLGAWITTITIAGFCSDLRADVFRKVKDTVEYQLPRIISLFETLIGYAFKTKGLLTKDTLDLSNIIRYFEVGAKTLLGADMVEKGVPVITVRKIEKRKIEGNNLIEQKEYFYKHLFNYTLFLDAYEKELLKRYR